MTPTPKANTPKSSWQCRAPTGKAAKKPVHAGRARPGSIRIIAGQHRGRKLPVLLAEGLRPTTDRVKETVFNWLMQDIAGAKVLDMFAGAGSLGFEAISRMASRVVMVEHNRNNALQLLKNVAVLNAQKQSEVVAGDAFSALTQQSTPFDIVFIDPPFHQGLVQRAVDALVEQQLLKPDALIYIESESSLPDLEQGRLVKIKQQTTQQVCYRLYRHEPLGKD
jgi:16S rRNA (guanine966-N2)-methyltransferase